MASAGSSRGERGFAVLRRYPRLGASSRDPRRAVHRLHCRVGEERDLVAGEFFLGQKPRKAAVLAEEDSLFADEEAAVVGEFFAWGQRGELGGREEAAVVPNHSNGAIGRVFGAWKLVINCFRLRKRFGLGWGPYVPDLTRRGQVEAPIDGVDDVATHVAEGACAKIEPAAPGERMIDLLDKRPLGRDAEPQVPVDVFWNG